MRVKALRREQLGLRGLPGRGDMGAGHGGDRRSVPERSSGQGEGAEGPEGGCPEVGGWGGLALG